MIIFRQDEVVVCNLDDDGKLICNSMDETLNKKILREAIIAELGAINLYEGFASITNDEKIRDVLLDVANEEKVHVGEFLELLLEIDEKQVEGIKKGKKEVYVLGGV